MVICKFFLQGTCKFGDFCKFEHQLNDNFHTYNSANILRQPQFVNNHQQQQKPAMNPMNVDTVTLVKSVVNDMMGAEKGGQWLLTCYAPFKEKPAFPGFEDHSFEEIRFGYYEAKKNGTLEQYKQQVQMLLQQAIMRIKSLQTPSPDIVNLLKSIYNTPPSSNCGVYGTNTVTATTAFGNATNTSGAFNQQQSSFGQQPTSVFAQSNQNIFGKPPQPQNQFSGASGSIFGGGVTQNQASSSIFGGNQAQAQNPTSNIFQQANNNFGTQSGSSIFAGRQAATPQANIGSIFAGQSSGSSIFGGGGGQPPNNSVFGGQQSNTSSIFSGQQNVSPSYDSRPQAQQSSGNVFNNSFSPPNPSNRFGQGIFGASSNVQMNQSLGIATTAQSMPQQTSTNVFAMSSNQPQTAQKSMFSQQQPSVFNQQNAGSFFNQQTNTSHMSSSVTDAKSHSSSIFGGSQSTAILNSRFGQTQQADETIYSKLEELTEDDIKWFESDDLDISKIPEKPPTYQMCFKV